MKMFTNSEQTAKLMVLGVEKSKSKVLFEVGNNELGYAYSIGELIEILDGKVTLEIDNVGEIWMISTSIFDFIGAELIDCLFDACVKLKEEGVI